MQPRFKIDDSGRIYDLADVRMVSLKLILRLRREGERLGIDLDIDELERMQADLEKAEDKAARATHPDAMMFLAVSIWVSRQLAGEDLSFEEAIDFPLVDLEFLPDP